MIQDTLRNIGGIGLYGVISVCLFLAVFTGMLVWAFLLKKPYLESMSQLPLHDDRDAARPLTQGYSQKPSAYSQPDLSHE